MSNRQGMTRYIIQRILYMLLTLFIIVVMCFVLIKLLPLPLIKQQGKDSTLVEIRRLKMVV